MAAPSKLTTALLGKLDDIADEGLTLKELVKKIGISDNTFRGYENREPDGSEEHAEFLRLAARARAGMGSATDDMAWGVLREVAEDCEAKTTDRLAAATAILRLRTAHKVELTGKDGGAVEVDVGGARDLLMAGIERLVPKDATDGGA